MYLLSGAPWTFPYASSKGQTNNACSKFSMRSFRVSSPWQQVSKETPLCSFMAQLLPYCGYYSTLKVQQGLSCEARLANSAKSMHSENLPLAALFRVHNTKYHTLEAKIRK
jgi:hypothetical protein